VPTSSSEPTTALEVDASGRRLDDAREDLEQRALARAVPPDHADDVAVRDIERNVPQCPEPIDLTRLAPSCEGPRRAANAVHHRFPERPMRGTRPELILFPEPLDANGGRR
jgi:hypothetical protein